MGKYEENWFLTGLTLGGSCGIISLLLKFSKNPYSLFPFISDTGEFAISLYELGFVFIFFISCFLALKLRAQILLSHNSFIAGLIAWENEIVSCDILICIYSFVGSILLAYIFLYYPLTFIEVPHFAAELIILLCISITIFGLGGIWEESLPENNHTSSRHVNHITSRDRFE